MALRGETIGQAYVRILADGSGFSDSAKDEIRQHQDDFGDAGEDASDNFWKGYDKESERNAETSLDKTIKTFDKSRGRFAAQGELSGSSFMRGVREALNDAFGDDIGGVIGRNLSEGLESGAIRGTAGIRARLANIGPEVAKATKQITDEQVNQWRIGYNQINRETEAGMRRVAQTLRQGAARVNVVEALFGESETDSQMYVDRLVRQFGLLKNAIDNYDKSVVKGSAARAQFRTHLVQIAEAMPDAVRGTAAFQREVTRLAGVLDPAGTRLERFRAGYARLGDTFGKAFGRGSRNDFLNLIGSMVRGLTQVGQPLLKVIAGFQEFGQRYRSLRDQGAGFFESLGKSLSSFGGPILQLGVLVAAIGSVVAILPALGAAVSLVTGLVLALAGSLGFALVGALGAVAGALVPFAAAFGVAALAVAGLPDKSPALENLKATFTDLQKTASAGLFGKDGAGLANLEPILKSLTPIVDTVSKALGGLLTELGKVGQSKAFTDMMSGINAIIGPMVTSLGQIGGKLAIGLGQAFVAAGPIIQEFLGWLDSVMDKFVAFGQGGDQSGLADWFNRAWESAKVVGDLIGNIIELIGQLFSAGKGTGDTLFQGIADKVQEIVTWLSKPEGQKALAQWFADAQKLGQEIGNVVVKVVEFVDALDTPESREFVLFLVQGFGRLIGVFTSLTPVMHGIVGLIMGIGNAVMSVIGWFQRLPGMIAGAAAAIGTWATGVWGMITGAVTSWAAAIGNFFTVTVPGFFTAFFANVQARWSAFWSGLTTWVSAAISALPGILANIGVFIIQALVGIPIFLATLPIRIIGIFQNLGPKIVTAMGDLAGRFAAWVATLPEKARAAATAIVRGFIGLANKIIAAAGDLAGRFSSWVASLPGKARQAATNIINGFSNLASRIISKAGSIATAFAGWVKALPGKAKDAATSILNAFSGLASKIVSKMGSISSAFSGFVADVRSAAGRAADALVNAFRGTASRIVAAIGTVVPKWALPAKLRAAGGVVTRAEHAIIGEAGPEAIVPLNRPLSKVDPAVRELSAIAQGLKAPNMANGGVSERPVEITIVTPTKDPAAVAAEVFARVAAASYI